MKDKFGLWEILPDLETGEDGQQGKQHLVVENLTGKPGKLDIKEIICT